MSDDALTTTMDGSNLHPNADNLVEISLMNHVADTLMKITGEPGTPIALKG